PRPTPPPTQHALRRPWLRLQPAPTTPARARDPPAHRPSRCRARLWAREGPLGHRARVRLVARVQAAADPLRTPRRHPPRLPPTRLRPDLPPRTHEVIL